MIDEERGVSPDDVDCESHEEERSMAKVEKSVAIEWTKDGPVVSHLTGSEAKGALRQVLIMNAQLDEQRGKLAAALVALVHRDAMRGILGGDGQPALPMSTTVPKDSAEIGLQPWRWTLRPQADGSVRIEVDAPPPDPNVAPKIIS